MSEFVDDSRSNRHAIWVAIALVALFAVLLLLTLQRDGGTGALKPLRPAPTPAELVVNSQASLVTFDQLNEDPISFLNRRIRVTGDFERLAPPACRPYSGPQFRWGLVASDLQLDARGYESVVHLIPSGLSLTVEGVWQRYVGPLGCGKEPPTDTAWYLAVIRIVQPNPLPEFGGLVAGTLPDGGAPAAVPTATPDLAPTEPTPTPNPTLTATVIFTTPTATVTATPTVAGNETATPGPSPTDTPSPTPTTSPTAGPSPTRTPSPTPTSTPTPGPSPTPRPTVPAPPTPTPNPGGYPGDDGGGGGGGGYP